MIKNNQKTFPGASRKALTSSEPRSAVGIQTLECLWRWRAVTGRHSSSNGKKFFGSFFQKGTAFVP
jgi:hypothetical protein